MSFLTLVTRLLPFAAVVTPGSIVVEPTAHVQSMMLRVPQYSYNFSNYAVVEGAGGNGFLGSSTEVGRIAVAGCYLRTSLTNSFSIPERILRSRFLCSCYQVYAGQSSARRDDKGRNHRAGQSLG